MAYRAIPCSCDKHHCSHLTLYSLHLYMIILYWSSISAAAAELLSSVHCPYRSWHCWVHAVYER